MLGSLLILLLLFRARWLYFHTNAFTAAKILDSEYIKDDLTEEDEDEFREALKKIAKTPGCKWDLNGTIMSC